MKNFIQKIINSVLVTSFALGVVLLTHSITKEENKSVFLASILTGISPDQICAAEFVIPRGSAYPVNGIIEIQTVSVTVDTGNPTYCDGIDDVLFTENISGNDLKNSFISVFSSTPTCAQAVFDGNLIFLPDTFNSSCDAELIVPDTSNPGMPREVSSVDLTLEPVSCAAFQTSIIRGYGEGLENIVPGDLGEFASTPNGFDFTGAITDIDINYPSTTVNGAKTFQIHMDFVPDISIDPINGVGSRAEIVANNGNGVYEIKVRDEGVGNEAQTGLNFAYVFNDLLGADTPFIAYPDITDPRVILLQATEMGEHPNFDVVPGPGYECAVNELVLNQCFSGGVDGTGEGEGVLTLPLRLDNEILQGDSAVVFASDGRGSVEWISSHPSVLDVQTLSEAIQQDEGIPDFVDELLDDALATENVDEANGAYNVTNCDKLFDENNDFVSETCTVEATIPVTYDIAGIDYTVNVSIEDEVVPVTVQGSQLTGFLEGTATYTTGGGFSMNLTGTVTGSVTGAVTGQFSGTVNGQIQAPITGSTVLPVLISEPELTPTLVRDNITTISPTEGTLTDVPSSFTSTVKKQETDVSHVAILFGKRPGSTLLTALDEQGCIATFDVEVIEKKVILQMVGRQLGDVLDVSDTVQINAFVGGANQEIEELENITASGGIEWFSSNEDVASIDQTGLLTALRPGVTNITARYDTGDAEIGTIESIPLQVTVNKISGLHITFDENTQNKLPSEVVEAAHESVIIAVHNPEAAGQSFVVEGQTVAITLPAGTYTNDISKVEAIVDDLETSITGLVNSVAQPIVQVTTVEGFPGMLILQPLNQDYDSDADGIQDVDENDRVNIDTTALEEDVAILPTFENAVPLPASETYGLRVIAEYDNGATKLLPPTEFTWINTPVNYLEQASLDSGLIRLGGISGTSTVLAQFENADGSIVQSNYLTVTVDSGPVIEYIRRIGSTAVEKGSRIILRTKITDVDTIQNITSIETSLVLSNENTYLAISTDPDAIWFSAVPFLEQVTVVEQGTGESTGEEGEEGEGTTSNEPQTTSLPYVIYDIPVEIPVSAGLVDGVYKLIISITDAQNHTLHHVYPLRIGRVSGGDVNGDGAVDMVDVILTFQIASGIIPNPTPDQLVAANVDGVGGVTVVDVILLFNLVSNTQ